MLSGGAGQRAFTYAFEELFAVADGFRDIPMAGRTDTWILSNAAAAHGIPPEQLPRFQDVYLRHLERELQPPHPRKMIMPGVRPLLDALAAREDAYLALLTGSSNTSTFGATSSAGRLPTTRRIETAWFRKRWRAFAPVVARRSTPPMSSSSVIRRTTWPVRWLPARGRLAWRPDRSPSINSARAVRRSCSRT